MLIATKIAKWLLLLNSFTFMFGICWSYLCNFCNEEFDTDILDCATEQQIKYYCIDVVSIRIYLICRWKALGERL